MKIQISHYEFEISEPFRAGHILSAEEAKALNVTRSERIRNRVSRQLERHRDDGVLTGQDLADLRERVARIDSNFEFAARTGSKEKRGTIEAEARIVALERAEAEARTSNRGNDLALVEELMLVFLDDPITEAEAARRIEARKIVAASSLSEL